MACGETAVCSMWPVACRKCHVVPTGHDLQATSCSCYKRQTTCNRLPSSRVTGHNVHAWFAAHTVFLQATRHMPRADPVTSHKLLSPQNVGTHRSASPHNVPHLVQQSAAYMACCLLFVARSSFSTSHKLHTTGHPFLQATGNKLHATGCRPHGPLATS